MKIINNHGLKTNLQVRSDKISPLMRKIFFPQTKTNQPNKTHNSTVVLLNSVTSFHSNPNTHRCSARYLVKNEAYAPA